jgi:hypothetical protein
MFQYKSNLNLKIVQNDFFFKSENISKIYPKTEKPARKSKKPEESGRKPREKATEKPPHYWAWPS